MDRRAAGGVRKGNKVRRLLTVSTAAALLLALGLRLDPSPTPVQAFGLTVETPARSRAGEPLTVAVRAPGGGDAEFGATFRTAYRAYEVSGRLTNGAASFLAPAQATRAAGVLDVVVRIGPFAATSSTVVAARAVSTIPVPFVGARSIVAGESDRSMAVVIPSDRFGSPVTSPAPGLQVRYPRGEVQTFELTNASSLLWAWIPSSTTAGRALVTVVSSAGAGPERDLLIVPSDPIHVSFTADTPVRRADGVSFLELTTSAIADNFGNTVLDGTAVTVTTISGMGHRSVQKVMTFGGVARALVEMPDSAGPFTVEVTAGEVHFSQVLGLEGIVAEAPPVSVDWAGPLGVSLVVGPVVSEQGMPVPDGTVVTVESGDGAMARGWTLDGTAQIEISAELHSGLLVSVGGFVIEVGS